MPDSNAFSMLDLNILDIVRPKHPTWCLAFRAVTRAFIGGGGGGGYSYIRVLPDEVLLK